MPSSRGSSQLGDWTLISCIVGRFFTIWATRKLESFSFCDALFLSHLSQVCMASCFVFFPWLNRRTTDHLYSEEKINVSPLKGGYRALFHISPTWFHHQLLSFLSFPFFWKEFEPSPVEIFRICFEHNAFSSIPDSTILFATAQQILITWLFIV